MHRPRIAILSMFSGGVLIGLALLGACAPAPTPTPAPTHTAAALPANTALPPTATAVPTPEPTPTEVLAADYYCIECHSSKASLIASAKPEVVVEKESEGVG